eukprot:gene113-3505_t
MEEDDDDLISTSIPISLRSARTVVNPPKAPRVQEVFISKYYGSSACGDEDDGNLLEKTNAAVKRALQEQANPLKVKVDVSPERILMNQPNGKLLCMVPIKELRSYARHELPRGGKPKVLSLIAWNPEGVCMETRYSAHILVFATTHEAETVCHTINAAFKYNVEMVHQDQQDKKFAQLPGSQRKVPIVNAPILTLFVNAVSTGCTFDRIFFENSSGGGGGGGGGRVAKVIVDARETVCSSCRAVDVAVDAEVEVYAKTGSLFSQTWRKLASKDINWLGTFFALNKENLLQFLVWLEETSLHLQIACFAFLYFVTSLPMMAGCIVLNVAAVFLGFAPSESTARTSVGFLFGFWGGCLVSLAFATLGAILVTLGCRFLCLPMVLDLQEKHDQLNSLIHVLEGPTGFRIVVLVRMTFIPFGLQNAVFASAKLSLLAYAAATAIGIGPLVTMNSFMGSSLKNAEDVLSGHHHHSHLAIAQTILAIVITVIVSMLTRRELRRLQAHHSTSLTETCGTASFSRTRDYPTFLVYEDDKVANYLNQESAV